MPDKMLQAGFILAQVRCGIIASLSVIHGWERSAFAYNRLRRIVLGSFLLLMSLFHHCNGFRWQFPLGIIWVHRYRFRRFFFLLRFFRCSAHKTRIILCAAVCFHQANLSGLQPLFDNLVFAGCNHVQPGSSAGGQAQNAANLVTHLAFQLSGCFFLGQRILQRLVLCQTLTVGQVAGGGVRRDERNAVVQFAVAFPNQAGERVKSRISAHRQDAARRPAPVPADEHITIRLALYRNNFQRLPEAVLLDIILQTIHVADSIDLVIVRVRDNIPARNHDHLHLLPRRGGRLALGIHQAVQQSSAHCFISFGGSGIQPTTGRSILLL